MKFLLGLLIILVFATNSMYGFWSSKCKDVETSPDKVIRLLQNANCTLNEESKKFRENFKTFRDGMRSKFGVFKEIFRVNKKNMSGYEGLDHAIDVRMSTDDKGDSENEIKVEEEYLRTKRDDSNEVEETTEPVQENTENEQQEEEYEGVLNPQKYHILLAPNQCRPGQRFMSGRCRNLVFFD